MQLCQKEKYTIFSLLWKKNHMYAVAQDFPCLRRQHIKIIHFAKAEPSIPHGCKKMYKKPKIIGQIFKVQTMGHMVQLMCCPPFPFELHCLIKVHECQFPPHVMDIYRNSELCLLLLPCDLILLIESISYELSLSK